MKRLLFICVVCFLGCNKVVPGDNAKLSFVDCKNGYWSAVIDGPVFTKENYKFLSRYALKKGADSLPMENLIIFDNGYAEKLWRPKYNNIGMRIIPSFSEKEKEFLRKHTIAEFGRISKKGSVYHFDVREQQSDFAEYSDSL